jgi:predicted dehydrogenase
MTYRAGIVGAGGIAGMGILGMHDEADIGEKKFRASHAGGFDRTEGVELVAVADLDSEKLNTFCDAWDVPESGRYTDHREMYREADLDVVSVCTPSLFHRDPVVDAAEIAEPGVVWCEKPIAASMQEAEEMCAACEDAGVELLVNHSFRFTEKVEKLHELMVEEGLLGDVRSVSTQFRMELMRNSTHLLDLLVHLLDARAERVAGHITGENEAVDALNADRRVDDSGGGGFVVMEDGSFATVDCTPPREISSMSFSFIGTEGKLYLNNDDGEWRYWNLVEGEHVEEPLPGIDGAWSWEEDYENAFPNAAAHIVELLDGEAENRSPGRVATRSLEIIVAFYISEYTESQVELPLEEPLRDVTITSW